MVVHHIAAATVLGVITCGASILGAIKTVLELPQARRTFEQRNSSKVVTSNALVESNKRYIAAQNSMPLALSLIKPCLQKTEAIILERSFTSLSQIIQLQSDHIADHRALLSDATTLIGAQRDLIADHRRLAEYHWDLLQKGAWLIIYLAIALASVSYLHGAKLYDVSYDLEEFLSENTALTLLSPLFEIGLLAFSYPWSVLYILSQVFKVPVIALMTVFWSVLFVQATLPFKLSQGFTMMYTFVVFQVVAQTCRRNWFGYWLESSWASFLIDSMCEEILLFIVKKSTRFLLERQSARVRRSL
jgi:hypothetical protein